MPKQKASFIDLRSKSKGKKTRQGHGRCTKYNTRVGSKRFKKKRRGQGKQ
tara:strand:+ start:150 stop:299 length:150 start_codon:yes stop_codon:yes gene_type:complete